MHRAKRMARLMGEDLPGAPLGAHHNIGSSDRVGIAAGDLRFAQLSHPRDAHLGPGRATGHEGPVGIIVGIFTTPLRKLTETPCHIAALAIDVPRGSLVGGTRARCLVNSQVAQADGHVERFLVET